MVQKVGSLLFGKSFKYFFCIYTCYSNQVATVCDAVVIRRVRIGASQGVWGVLGGLGADLGVLEAFPGP